MRMIRRLILVSLGLWLLCPVLSMAAPVTVVKTIGSTGKFSTPQLWEDGAPADLTTAEKSACGSFLVAAFIQGENLTFVGSAATGRLSDTDSTGVGNGTYVTYGITAGNPATSDVVTGGTSGATCVLTSGTPTNVGIVWQGQLQNQEFSGTGTQLNIAGSTSSSTAYKELTTVAGASFADHANKLTNALSYNASNGAAIKGTSNATYTIGLAENFFRISKIQIAATGTNSGAVFGGNGSIMDQCILEGTYTGTSTQEGIYGTNSSMTVKNTVIIQRATGATQIIGTLTATVNFYNVTFVAPDDLATAPTQIFNSGASGTVNCSNCSLFAGDSTKAVKAGSATYTFTTSYSDISGTTGVTQATYSSEFQDVNDATRDFRLKTGAAQINTGTTDSTNAPADVVGTTRPQGASYDVGAWEFTASGGGGAGGPVTDDEDEEES